MITERTQLLADGNRITEKHTSTVARDSEGRMRNEATVTTVGAVPVAPEPAKIVMILDPVQQASYTLEMNSKTARKRILPAGPDLETRRKLEAERRGSATGQQAEAAGRDAKLAAEARERAEVHKESLGRQVVEGVLADGVKTVRTIPSGEIGNERPIEIVDEVWTSADLKAVVLSKHSDPRTGEMIYRLTNISRTEPPASLFQVPSDFKLVDDNESTFVYRPRD